MSRHRSDRDPVSGRATDHATAKVFEDSFEAVLATLSRREAAVMRLLLTGASLELIAQVYELSTDRTRALLSHIVGKLRHPSRTAVIRDFYEDAEFGRMMARYGRFSGVGELAGVDSDVVWCEQHQDWGLRLGGCEYCSCPLDRPLLDEVGELYGTAGRLVRKPGRPRKFCCDACKMRAHRQNEKHRGADARP